MLHITTCEPHRQHHPPPATSELNNPKLGRIVSRWRPRRHAEARTANLCVKKRRGLCMGALALVFGVTNRRDAGKCRKEQTELNRSESVQMEIQELFVLALGASSGATEVAVSKSPVCPAQPGCAAVQPVSLGEP